MFSKKAFPKISQNLQRNTCAAVSFNNPKNASFKIKDTKLYVPLLTLSTEDYSKLLEQLKTGYKETIKWNKYWSEMSIRLKLTTFNTVNRLFVLSFENEDDRTSF